MWPRQLGCLFVVEPAKAALDASMSALELPGCMGCCWSLEQEEAELVPAPSSPRCVGRARWRGGPRRWRPGTSLRQRRRCTVCLWTTQGTLPDPTPDAPDPDDLNNPTNRPGRSVSHPGVPAEPFKALERRTSDQNGALRSHHLFAVQAPPQSLAGSQQHAFNPLLLPPCSCWGTRRHGGVCQQAVQLAAAPARSRSAGPATCCCAIALGLSR